MRRIKDCTLIAIDTVNPGAAIASLRKSMAQCEFDKVLLYTNIDLKLEGINTVQIPEIKSKDEYSEFILKHAYLPITTNYVLVTQHDSWVLNGDCFDERLYQYDWAGALWIENDGLANGNGGLSWRSKRLMKIIAMDDHINATAPEDVAVCRVYRRYLEKNYDLKWAPDDICEAFSFELRCPTQRTFGFHNFFHEPYKPIVVIRRLDAMGDAIQVEPVMEHFHNKGYRVVFETLPQFESLFYNHYFPVLFPRQIDPKVLATAKVYNLTMSYESNPKQLHLKSYYDFCEVPESEQVIRNPKLNVVVDKSNTLFPQKYVVLHIDQRAQPGRNVYGVEWYRVVEYLRNKGYLVIQIGKGDSIDTGAIRMNTLAEPMMAYLLAGCDAMIAVDSGPANVAVALGRKLIVFHGNVNPDYIWPDQTNIRVITNHKPNSNLCSLKYCWHETIGVEGQQCIDNKVSPPCTKFKTEQVIDAINELICQKEN
jgi:ADP-heptose:LPS heptosyltransferase